MIKNIVKTLNVIRAK